MNNLLDVRKKWDEFERQMIALVEMCGDCLLELSPKFYDEMRDYYVALYGPTTKEISFVGQNGIVFMKRRQQ